jgi:rhodanese-related sulfurtransferase
MSELPRDHTIVVYCASGMRSARAATALRSAGYEVRDLGPMSNWN